VFSPYYAAARRRGSADPEDHVAINVALYGDRPRWAMTERGRGALRRSADRIDVGASKVSVLGDRLVIEVDEWCVPVPRRLVGRIEIDAGPVFDEVHVLDGPGRHRWRPIAPLARAKVSFSRPDVRWQGAAYLDCNAGDDPLESAFRSWTWSRATTRDAATVFYDVQERDGDGRRLALHLRTDGRVSKAAAPPLVTLPPTLWRVARSVRSEGRPEAIRSLEDAPFYTRTATTTFLDGRRCETVCESVDLDRFASRWVRMLLPFRMPRRTR
jgi:carotenoid 1,2-hydratase